MSSYVTVTLPNSEFQFSRVYSVNLYQDNYKHDYAEIYFKDWGVSPKFIKPGTLITLNIRGKDYYGYINNIQNVQENGKNFTKIGFMGASYIMKQASQKIYLDMTADQVVAEIASKYNFAFKAAAHPRVYPQIAQAGLSDWELMLRLAKQSGYFLRAENTEIYFQPFDQDFNDLHNQALSFQKADGGFKPINPIYSFKPIIGETFNSLGFEKASVSVAGIDPNTGSYFKYTKQDSFTHSRELFNQPFFDKHDTVTVLNDYTTAAQTGKAIDEHGRFPYQAIVEVIGTSELRPGMPVYLNNVGEDYSGYWTILAVKHRVIEKQMNQQMFTTTLTVGTDSLGQIADTKKNVIPPSDRIREIIPNSRNTVVKPETVINKPGLSIKPAKSINLVNKVNVASSSGQLTTSATWASTHRDLGTPRPYTTIPIEAMEKVKSNALRN